MVGKMYTIYSYNCFSCVLFRSTKRFISFVDAIKIEDGVGGDTAEDVYGGLKVVLDPEKIKWLTDVYATKVICKLHESSDVAN